MSNNLQIFNHTEFGQVRVIVKDNKEYFAGGDIAKALGYAIPTKAINTHCKGVSKMEVPTNGGIQEMLFITEGDIYRLIVKAADQSKNPKIKEKAEKFESWIFDEVLPTIRKTGGYVASEDLFVDTYLPYVDEQTKALFKTNLSMIRKQNEIIALKEKEIEYKKDVIIGLVDEISLAEKRQILNRVVRYKGANYKERWRELYKQFSMKYHIDLDYQLEKYNSNNKPKLKNKIDYIDKVMNKIPELYEIACKLYENDVKELAKNLYSLNEEAI